MTIPRDEAGQGEYPGRLQATRHNHGEIGMSTDRADTNQPLGRLDEWDDFVKDRVYPTAGHKAREDYRNYEAPARSGVREFYRQNHRAQTLDFVLDCKARYLPLRNRAMSVFEALDFLNTLVDDSDPDIELSQLEHLL